MTGLSRTGDLTTSHDAAASISATFLEDMVLAELKKAGARGMTLDDICAATALDKVTASPRLRPLCNKQLVVENGKRPGNSGRAQTVWVAL